MPIFNGAAQVKETLDSVLAQTFTAWELLAIDDGSDDDSAAIVESLGHPAMRVLCHPGRRNRGQFASRVLGARHARSSQ